MHDFRVLCTALLCRKSLTALSTGKRLLSRLCALSGGTRSPSLALWSQILLAGSTSHREASTTPKIQDNATNLATSPIQHHVSIITHLLLLLNHGNTMLQYLHTNRQLRHAVSHLCHLVS